MHRETGRPSDTGTRIDSVWPRTLQTCFQQEDRFWQGQVALRKGLGEGFSLPPRLSMDSEEGHSHPLPGAAGGPAST